MALLLNRAKVGGFERVFYHQVQAVSKTPGSVASLSGEQQQPRWPDYLLQHLQPGPLCLQVSEFNCSVQVTFM